GTFGDKLSGIDGRNIPGTALLHQLHIPQVHEGTVFDGIDPADYRSPNGFGSVRVHGDGVAIIVGRSNDGIDFFLGKLRIICASRKVEYAARSHDLDKVHALFVMLTHGLPGAIRAIDDCLVGAWIALQFQIQAVSPIGVPTSRSDRRASSEDARTFRPSGI